MKKQLFFLSILMAFASTTMPAGSDKGKEKAETNERIENNTTYSGTKRKQPETATKEQGYTKKLKLSNAENEAHNAFGNTPLHVAVEQANVDLVQQLEDKKQLQQNPTYLLDSLKTTLDLLLELSKVCNEPSSTESARLELINKKNELKNKISKEFDKELIKKLINAGADINQKNDEGRTVLNIAVKATEDLSFIKYLLDEKADVNARTNHNVTVLHSAVAQNTNPEIIQLLISSGADVNAKNNDNWTPLHYATRYSNTPEIIKYLIDSGADVNAKNNINWTPLHYATRHSNTPETIKYLIENGADVNAKNNDNWTPLHLAAGFSNNPEMTKYLINGSAKVDINAQNASGETPLDSAISNRRLVTAQLLIAAGADGNMLDQNLNSPLHIAVGDNNFLDTLRLLEMGADREEKNKEGATPLQIAKKNNYADIIKLFDLDLHYPFILHQACQKNNIRLLHGLLDIGKDINLKDGTGSTPLHFAAHAGNKEAIEMLIRRGADIHLERNDGINAVQLAEEQHGHEFAQNITTISHRKALLDACKDNDLQTVKQLLNSGTNINMQDEKTGDTALHIAAKNGFEEMVALLLNHQADVNIRNEKGKYSFQEASTENIKEFIIFKALELGKYSNLLGYKITRLCNEETLIKILEKLPAGTLFFEDEDTMLARTMDHDFDNAAKLIIEKSSLALFEMDDTNTDDGHCALHSAINHKKYHLAKMIIDRLEPKNLNLMQGDHSVLYWAITDGHSDIAKEMIYAGAIMDEDEKKKIKERGFEEFIIAFEARDALAANLFALHDACSNDAITYIPHLLQLYEKQSRDINIRNEQGLTPLHCAVIQGNLETVVMLLEHEASVDITTGDNKTTLELTNNNSLKGLLTQANRASLAKSLLVSNPFAFIEACQNNDVKTLEILIDFIPDINLQDIEGKTALHYAAQQNNDELIRQISKRYISRLNLYIPDTQNTIPLELATEQTTQNILHKMDLIKQNPDGLFSYLDTQEYYNSLISQNIETFYKMEQISFSELLKFIELGADFNTKTDNGVTLLHCAMYSSYFENNDAQINAIQFLIDCGADVNGKMSGELRITPHFNNYEHQKLPSICMHISPLNTTPLQRHLTSNSPRNAVIELLLEHGADVNASDNSGYTPLLYAIKNKNKKEIIELLLKHHADVNAADNNGCTPLHDASLFQEKNDIIELLLEHGADVNAADNNGNTPLHHVSGFRKKNDIIELFLKYDADVNAANNSGKTPLHYIMENLALYNSRDVGSALEKFDLLLENGADVNAANNEGYTPLHAAGQKRFIELIEMMIDHNADINALHKDWSALAYAIEHSNFNVATILIEHGASPFMPHKRCIAEQAIKKNAPLEFIKLLVEKYNLTTIRGTGTPLHHALSSNNLEVAKWFLQNIATPVTIKEKSNSQHTPFQLAIRNPAMFKTFITNYPINWTLQLAQYLKNPRTLIQPDLIHWVEGEKELEKLREANKKNIAKGIQMPSKLIDLSALVIARAHSRKLTEVSSVELEKNIYEKMIALLCERYLEYIKNIINLEEFPENTQGEVQSIATHITEAQLFDELDQDMQAEIKWNIENSSIMQHISISTQPTREYETIEGPFCLFKPQPKN